MAANHGDAGDRLTRHVIYHAVCSLARASSFQTVVVEPLWQRRRAAGD